jgi:hypothetical protein
MDREFVQGEDDLSPDAMRKRNRPPPAQAAERKAPAVKKEVKKKKAAIPKKDPSTAASESKAPSTSKLFGQISAGTNALKERPAAVKGKSVAAAEAAAVDDDPVAFIPKHLAGTGLDVVTSTVERDNAIAAALVARKTSKKKRIAILKPEEKRGQGVKSACWYFFRTAKPGEDAAFVYCIACEHKGQVSEGNASHRVAITDFGKEKAKLKTSNCQSHLVACHEKWWKTVRDVAAAGNSAEASFKSLCKQAGPLIVQQQTTLTSFIKKAHREAGKLEKELALVIWMVRNRISFESLKDKEWENMCNIWGIAVSSSDTLKRHLFPLLVVALRHGEKAVRDAGTYSLSIDYWTSLAKDKYLAISYHFATPDFCVQSRLLDLCHVQASATALMTSEVIQLRVNKHFTKHRVLFK